MEILAYSIHRELSNCKRLVHFDPHLIPNGPNAYHIHLESQQKGKQWRERATMHFSQTAPSSQHRSSGSRWVCPILPERAVNCHRHLHHRSLKSQWHSQADGRRDYPTKQPPHVHGDDLPKAIRKLANT